MDAAPPPAAAARQRLNADAARRKRRKAAPSRARPNMQNEHDGAAAVVDDPAAAAFWVKLTTLHPWPGNPTKDDPASVRRVADSITRFGFGAPIVARKQNGEIIAGHTRFKAAQLLKLQRVPVRFVDITEHDAHVLALADNQLAALTLRDDELLADALRSMPAADQVVAGYTPQDVEQLLRKLQGTRETDAHSLWDQARFVDALFDFYVDKHPADFAPPLWQQLVEVDRLASGSQTHGYHVPDAYYPHRYDCICGNAPESLAATLRNHDVLRKAIASVVERGLAGSVYSTLGNLQRYRGRQPAAQFNPVVARDAYRANCEPGARVLDPCAGWGGRLLGWHASLLGGDYHGFDASRMSCDSAAAMTAALRIVGARVEHAAFEDVQLDECAYDFAFTSPPYYSQERYSTDPEQSCVRYTSYDKWRDGFLHPLITKTYAALRPGCALLLNIDDVRQGSRVLPLVADTRAVAGGVGFALEYAYEHSFAVSNASFNGQAEPFLLFRKPSKQ